MQISLHFTLKGQSLKEVKLKFEKSDFYKRLDARDSLNHCFLTREEVELRGFDTEVVDYLEDFSGDVQQWFDSMKTLPMKRDSMLDYIKETNGMAVFVGDLIEGVKEEFDLAMKKGLQVVIIP